MVSTGSGLPCAPLILGAKGTVSTTAQYLLEEFIEDGGDSGDESRPWGWKTQNQIRALHISSLRVPMQATFKNTDTPSLCLGLPFCQVARVTEPTSLGSCGKSVRSCKSHGQHRAWHTELNRGKEVMVIVGQKYIKQCKLFDCVPHSSVIKQRDGVGALGLQRKESGGPRMRLRGGIRP